jgi:hypothetical protein
MARQPTKTAHAGEPVITDEVRKVSELTADPRNARRHSEAQISQIVQSIERFGFVEKLTIRPDGQIIGGHARLEALKRIEHADPLQARTVECRVVDHYRPARRVHQTAAESRARGGGELPKGAARSRFCLTARRHQCPCSDISLKRKYRMTGAEAISNLKRKFRVATDASLAERLGMSIPSVQVWKKRPKVIARQLAEIVDRACRAGAKASQATALRPLVEFFRIERQRTSHGIAYRVFEDGAHPYKQGLRQELDSHRGVYLFFDSRGQAIYTGKARRQSLWTEINSVFNRDRGVLQKIKRVNHPTSKVAYRTGNEKTRKIVDSSVPLHEIATYFSAYHVSDGMINNLEALLVRSFANNILNKKMESFSSQTKKKPMA